MPYSTIRVENNGAQQLFQEVIETVPRLYYEAFGSRAKHKPKTPYSADLLFLKDQCDRLKVRAIGDVEFDQLLKKMPRLINKGYLIGESHLKLFPFMKSFIFLSPGEETGGAITLGIPRPFLDALDPEEQVMGWWIRLGEKFNQKSTDLSIVS